MIEITKEVPLLDKNGNIAYPGYAKKMYWKYDRNDIKVPKYKIKEWDYYLIVNDDMGIALTMDDNGYMGLMSLSLLDFNNKIEKTVSQIFAFPLGKLNFPKRSDYGKITYTDKKCNFCFHTHDGIRELDCLMKDFHDGKDAMVHLVLSEEPEESIVVATPFEKPKHFYYNQKINCMVANGSVTYGNQVIKIENAHATLDWGRGVWTYHNTWIWGSASGIVDGHKFGFNIGYGFGDTSAASENMLFYDGKAHKIEHIKADIPANYTDNWTITSSDGRFEMLFEPILNRAACTDVKLIKSDQNQVFGYYTGKAILDDGSEIVLDKFLGFIEEVENKW